MLSNLCRYFVPLLHTDQSLSLPWISPVMVSTHGLSLTPQFCSCHVYAMHIIVLYVLYSINCVNNLFPPLESECLCSGELGCWMGNKSHSLSCGVSHIEFKWGSERSEHLCSNLVVSREKTPHYQWRYKGGRHIKISSVKNTYGVGMLMGQEQGWDWRHRIDCSIIFIQIFIQWLAHVGRSEELCQGRMLCWDQELLHEDLVKRVSGI